MYQAKLCLGLSGQFEFSPPEQIRVLRQTGFEAFFSGWSDETDIAVLRRTADETGMEYQSIHAPYHKMADMWRESDAAENAVGELIRCVDSCAEYGVPIMVAHAFIGFKDHSPTSLGLDSFGRVVREAERRGVKIAFENTEGEEYLSVLMAHFRGCKGVGFCWDTGHEMCYNHGRDMLALYGDRLLCTHINDNLGIQDFGGETTPRDDLHLLPFDGAADWEGIARRLNQWGYEGTLSFELNRAKPGRLENEVYGRMDIREYLAHAYIRACRLGALKQRIAQK